MARIRNIKPAFFRHEALQDLEAAHPGRYIMLTYIGLWTQCDAAGVFPWKPRLLKLDILPFLDFQIEATMAILAENGFITTYTANGEKWGYVPAFERHQRVTGKELTEGEKYPKPGQNDSDENRETTGKQPGNNRETTGKQPGAQERSTGKDNREGVNAHAHEGFPEIEKQKTATTPPDRQQPAPEPLGDFARVYNAISSWGESDAGHAEIVEWKKITGYRDSQHGPTTDEVTKFVSYHLGAKTTAENRAAFIRDPLAYFRDKFPGWLTNAKAWNRPGAPRARGKPPENARPYHQPAPQQQRRSGPATEPVALAAFIANAKLPTPP